MNDLFSQLQEVLLQSDESLDLYVKRDSRGLSVTVVPRLKESQPATQPSHIAQARATLAIPLFIQGSGAELDSAFAQHLKGYATGRRTLHDSIESALIELQEANKALRSKSRPKETGKAPSKSAADAAPDSEPAAAPAEEATPTQTTQATDTDEKPTTTQDMSQPLSLF